MTRAAESTGQCLQACAKSLLFLREPKFSCDSLLILLASISTTLARNRKKPPLLVLSLSKESRAEHHCCASNAPIQACRLGLQLRAHNPRAISY